MTATASPRAKTRGVKSTAPKSAPKSAVKRSAAKGTQPKSTKPKSKSATAKTKAKASVKVKAPISARAPIPVKAVDAKPVDRRILDAILASLEDMKAEETVSIDLAGKAAFADSMVVTSGRSTRHVGAVADNVIEALHKAGAKSLRIEGKKNCDWVLIDAGDVVVHIFRPEVRSFYEIEKMWSGSAQLQAG